VLTHAGLKVDLRIGAEEEFGDLLQHFTGSAAHNVQLRERALGRGLSVSEYGVAEVEGKKIHKFADEQASTSCSGFPTSSRSSARAAARSRRGTRRAADLVTVEDIRGDLHCHTTLSDGRNRSRRWRRRPGGADTPTSPSLTIPPVTASETTSAPGSWPGGSARSERGTSPRRVGSGCWPGSEVNIGTDGSPDYPDELLAELDWVICSVHTSFNISEKAMTERVIAAMEHRSSTASAT
jgi:DNA polymerase (family 10)